MRIRKTVVWMVFSVLATSVAWAELPPGPVTRQGAGRSPARQGPLRKNGLDEFLIPPDFIVQHEGRLKLTPEQRSAIQEEALHLQEQLPERQAQLQKEVGAMGDLLKAEVRDEPAVLGQLDRLLDEERQVKRLQLAMLLRVRNQLTGEQLIEVGKIREEMIARRRELQQRLSDKMRRVQQMVQQQAQAGQPPNEVVEQMRAFPGLMQQGKVEEAEAILDKSLEQLGGR